MTEPDYKIQELFDVDKMQQYYVVLERVHFTSEYKIVRKFYVFHEAEYCIRMMRKYNKPIFHYVEE